MKQTVVASICAGALALATTVGAQSSDETQPSAPATQTGTAQQGGTQQPASGPQPATKAGAQQAGAEQTVTLTGCVHTASDQPTMLALRRMGEGTSAQQSGATAGAATGGAGAGASQATATTGTGARADANTDGAIYRLAPPTGQDLKQFTGRRVEIVGRLIPGKDEKGADVVIHRLEPTRTVFTAIDLKPAPELRVSSIRELPGNCTPTTGTAR